MRSLIKARKESNDLQDEIGKLETRRDQHLSRFKLDYSKNVQDLRAELTNQFPHIKSGAETLAQGHGWDPMKTTQNRSATLRGVREIQQYVVEQIRNKYLKDILFKKEIFSEVRSFIVKIINLKLTKTQDIKTQDIESCATLLGILDNPEESLRTKLRACMKVSNNFFSKEERQRLGAFLALREGNQEAAHEEVKRWALYQHSRSESELEERLVQQWGNPSESASAAAPVVNRTEEERQDLKTYNVLDKAANLKESKNDPALQEEILKAVMTAGQALNYGDDVQRAVEICALEQVMQPPQAAEKSAVNAHMRMDPAEFFQEYKCLLNDPCANRDRGTDTDPSITDAARIDKLTRKIQTKNTELAKAKEIFEGENAIFMTFKQHIETIAAKAYVEYLENFTKTTSPIRHRIKHGKSGRDRARNLMLKMLAHDNPMSHPIDVLSRAIAAERDHKWGFVDKSYLKILEREMKPALEQLKKDNSCGAKNPDFRSKDTLSRDDLNRIKDLIINQQADSTNKIKEILTKKTEHRQRQSAHWRREFARAKSLVVRLFTFSSTPAAPPISAPSPCFFQLPYSSYIKRKKEHKQFIADVRRFRPP